MPGELPDGLSFEDFVAAIHEVDKAEDVDLSTDWEGCSLNITLPVVEIAATVAKLRDPSLDPHTGVPAGEEIDRGAKASTWSRTRPSVGGARSCASSARPN